jgi:hypothetical protein
MNLISNHRHVKCFFVTHNLSQQAIIDPVASGVASTAWTASFSRAIRKLAAYGRSAKGGEAPGIFGSLYFYVDERGR